MTMAKSKFNKEFEELHQLYGLRVTELTIFLKFVDEKKEREANKKIRKIEKMMSREFTSHFELQEAERIRSSIILLRENEKSLSTELKKSLDTPEISELIKLPEVKQGAKVIVDSALNKLLHKEKGTLLKVFSETVGFPFSNIILKKMTLVYTVMLLEQLIKEYFRFFLVRNLGQLKSKTLDKAIRQERVIEFGLALSAKSIKELRSIIVEKETDRIGRISIDEIDKFFDLRVKICFSRQFEDWEELRAGYYLRNLFVHNGGVMNTEIRKQIKIGEIGKPIVLEMDRIQSLIEALGKFNNF